jgi:hypothetical protein
MFYREWTQSFAESHLMNRLVMRDRFFGKIREMLQSFAESTKMEPSAC